VYNNKKPGTDLNKCFSCALKFLSIRDYGEKELLAKLKQKGFSKENSETAIKKCIEYKYLDDKKYALRLFQYEKNKLNGSFKIKYTMLSKKLDEELVDEIISRYEGSPEEYDTAKKYLEKILYRIGKKNTRQKKYAAFIQSLNNKGFSKDIIMKLTDEYSHLFSC